MKRTAARSLADRIARLVERVLKAAACCAGLALALRAAAAAGAEEPAEKAVLGAVWWRIEGLRGRLLSLQARFRAGRLAPRKPAPRRPTVRGRAGETRAPSLAQTLAALARMAPEADGEGEGEGGFLADPEIVALIEAAPAEAGRILRPLCGLLGMAVPEALRVRRRAVAPRARESCGEEHSQVPTAAQAPGSGMLAASPRLPLTLPLRGPLPPGQARGQACPQGGRGIFPDSFSKMEFATGEAYVQIVTN